MWFSASSEGAFVDPIQDAGAEKIRLSKLISQHARNMALSRRETERRISGGHVTVAGKVITAPHFLLSWNESSNSVKVDGELVLLAKTKQDQTLKDTRVWLVHKLPGEVVSENDPKGRPSLLERLVRSGVGKVRGGKKNKERCHLKPIGRLDMSTEGLILVTSSGKYAREMELPSNKMHRVYRARVHGKLTQYKLKAIQSGVTVGNVHYGPMKVSVEGSKRKEFSTNTWIRITCTEGKNRQVRNVLSQLGLTVTRLIRVSYGDYQLQTIPRGMALEVPMKPLDQQKRQGPLFPPKRQQKAEEPVNPVQWVTHYSSNHNG